MKRWVWPIVIVVVLGGTGLFISHDNFFWLRQKSYAIPSSSMLPTLQVGDLIFVTQQDYMPARGDIVAFLGPGKKTHLKRVVAIAGDHVSVKNGQVVLNDKQLPLRNLGETIETTATGPKKYTKYRETLPGGVSYEVLDFKQGGLLDNTPEFTVSDGHVFVLGDNRDEALDSRTRSHIGDVPVGDVIGVAHHVFYSGPDGRPVWRPVSAD